MDHFSYKNGQLFAEDVNIAALAQKVGTPFYCYSAATLKRHAQVFRDALKPMKPLICFAVKANSNLAVLKLLGKEGIGADVVSEGEARRALAAGIPARNIVFSGVGKTAEEMKFALEAGIFQFNVESDRELLTLNDVALASKKKAAIAFRVNPDVDAKTHAKISTGKKENKFGVDIDVAPALYALAHSLPGITVQGVSVHIGSQLTTLEPFRDAYLRVRALGEQLRADGIPIHTIDLGGGLGVPYDDHAPPLPDAYGKIVQEVFGGFDAQFIFEPGRLIVGNAGILVSKILYVKRAAKTYVVLDAGMNDLMRPALYEAVHNLIPVEESVEALTADVVGPVCESTDLFAKDVPVRGAKEGALVAFRTAGAYGATLSNSYNTRLMVPEVLVDGAKFAVIRPRPSYEQLLGQDHIPDWI